MRLEIKIVLKSLLGKRQSFKAHNFFLILTKFSISQTVTTSNIICKKEAASTSFEVFIALPYKEKTTREGRYSDFSCSEKKILNHSS